MDRRQLRYFVAIYEHRNLSRAAAACNVAQSALSLHMTNLEANLGTPLFVRMPRGMAPTAAGERLYTHAKAILRAMEAAEADLRHASDRIAGDVAIGMAHSAVKAIGVRFMTTVAERYPEVRISISESVSASVLMHVMRSDVDMALLYNPPADPALAIEPVLEETMLCVGRPEIIGETDAPITFAGAPGVADRASEAGRLVPRADGRREPAEEARSRGRSCRWIRCRRSPGRSARALAAPSAPG